MALDREKTFANAERLLKQGKTAQALDECRRLAEDAPRDLLMLNRLGDFLARGNRGADAIVYYEKIAEQFSASGFYPKAIAILKKIIKVDPNHLAAVVRLGELNMKQKLPGEARAWLLQAAEAYLRNRDFAKAREVYEKLVEAEPENAVHVVRLAEARAAEGDAGRAGLELVALGTRMLAGGRTDDAERAFKRASELLPGRAEPIVGLARCEAAAGRQDEALRLAGKAWEATEGAEAVGGDLFLLFEHMGATESGAKLLSHVKSDGISDDALEQAFREALSAGKVDGLWSRVSPLLDRFTQSRQFDRSARLLERLSRIEDGGHLRALERLVELRKAEGNRGTTARAIERLVRAYQARGLKAQATSQLETLKLFDPSSPLLFLGGVPADVPPPREAATPPSPESPIASAFEAPAVPLSQADADFVNGNLTEADVFEKYGLQREALQQLRQITTRFPGHVVSQEKLVSFLRTQADRGALRDGLVALAFAKRASGDIEGARRATREAVASGGIESSIRAALVKLDLLAAEPPPAPAPAAQATPAPAPPKPTVPKPPPAAAPAAAPKATAANAAPAPKAPSTKAAAAPLAPAAAPPPKAASAPKSAPSPKPAPPGDEELEIIFEDLDVAAPSESSDAAETLEEIEFYLGQGMEKDALQRIAEARAAGVSGAALDALEARARATTDDGGGDDQERIQSDEEDLSAITAALEAEYGTDRVPEVGDAAPVPESDQSLDEVFESFREHVKAAVEEGDFRTHYDLGIAYKEMGLMDDAVAEFHIASGAPELYREACSMLGLCHWERGETEESIRWYRAALEAPGGEQVRLAALRYDLADKLEQTGDARGAYDLLVQVVREEPGYRDAKSRAAGLRSKLGL